MAPRRTDPSRFHFRRASAAPSHSYLHSVTSALHYTFLHRLDIPIADRCRELTVMRSNAYSSECDAAQRTTAIFPPSVHPAFTSFPSLLTLSHMYLSSFLSQSLSTHTCPSYLTASSPRTISHQVPHFRPVCLVLTAAAHHCKAGGGTLRGRSNCASPRSCG